MIRLRLILPLLIFFALGVLLYVGLGLRPREIPSALIDRPVPSVTLPALPGHEGFGPDDLTQGKVTLVNVFATWCVPCLAEHPVLIDLQTKHGLTIFGINYKDKPQAARDWLTRLGNPYARVGQDVYGRVGIEWGVYGVPETYVVAGDGRIVYKHIGPILIHDVEEKILPAVRAAARKADAS